MMIGGKIEEEIGKAMVEKKLALHKYQSALKVNLNFIKDKISWDYISWSISWVAKCQGSEYLNHPELM